MSQDVLTSDLNWCWTSSNENIKNQRCLSSTVIEAYMKYAVNGSNMSLKSSTKLHVRTQSWKCNFICIRKDSGCNDTTPAIALDRWNKLLICLTKKDVKFEPELISKHLQTLSVIESKINTISTTSSYCRKGIWTSSQRRDRKESRTDMESFLKQQWICVLLIITESRNTKSEFRVPYFSNSEILLISSELNVQYINRSVCEFEILFVMPWMAIQKTDHERNQEN